MAEVSENESAEQDAFECPICHKLFSIRASFVRHSRLCLERNLSQPRQKSCRQCSKKKLRCDRTLPKCSRCAARGSLCEYAADGRRTLKQKRQGADRPVVPATPAQTVSSASLGSDHHRDVVASISGGSLAAEASQNDNNHQTASRIAAALGSEARPIVKATVSHACRIFRTWPRMLSSQERLPPFIHRTQITGQSIPLPLANCLALCRMWMTDGAATMSGGILMSSLKTEIARLLDEYRTYDETTLTAAFQSVIIYAIILIFPVTHQPPSRMFDLATLAALKEFGLYIRSGTAMMPEEVSHTRPSWQQWVLVTCKRRTLLCLHALEWVNAMLNNFTRFPCNQAEFMPVPTNKVLFDATQQEKWEVAYDRWLGRWAGVDMFTVKDLQGLLPWIDLDSRSEMWLAEADELGTFFLTMNNAAEP